MKKSADRPFPASFVVNRCPCDPIWSDVGRIRKMIRRLLWETPRMIGLAAFLLASVALAPSASDRPRAATAAESAAANPALKVAGLDAVLGLYQQKRYAEAEASARKLLAKVEAARGPDAPETCRVLDVVVSCIVRQGKSKDPDARALAERAEAIREKSPESLNADRLATLRN